MVDRVPCRDCGAMILPVTFAENDGLCATCVRIPEELRRAQREYDRRLRTGEVFTLNEDERKTARESNSLGLFAAAWKLEPDYYSDRSADSPSSVLASAAEMPSGEVYLVDGEQKRLNFTFNEFYAVCDYSDLKLGLFFAYSSDNLRQQVDRECHVGQGCTCCGVGVGWYPSRCHMPRKLGFQLVKAILENERLPQVQWIEADDFSYVNQGKG